MKHGDACMKIMGSVIPEKIAKIRYRVPMSLALVE